MQEKHEEAHWHGIKNKSIRYYFYAQRGLALINEMRYLAIGIGGLYFLLKLTNPWWMVLMFCVCVPVLILLGWAQTNHMAKVIDWLGVTYASYWSKRQMDWQERQVKAVEEIRDCVVRPKVYCDPNDWKPTVRIASISSAPIAEEDHLAYEARAHNLKSNVDKLSTGG